ncbi:ciliary neurotrophic factor receptor subunit alpha isoform X2 [Larus michahellis]
MANPVPSACCVVLAAVVVVYAQRHSQQDSHIQYERVGADVTMKCGSMDWDAAVTWTANGTDIDESHLNGSYLILKNVDLTHSGQYSCYEGSSWHLKYQTYLGVGTPPKEPVLMCRSNNYPKGFYCSWHLPTPTYIPNFFNISVIHGMREMVCEKDIFPKNRCRGKTLRPGLTPSLSHSSSSCGIGPSSWTSGNMSSCRMGHPTPSRTPMLARSTSSRWRPKTMTLARGVTGAWPSMPPPGQRSPSISPRRPRPQRQRALAPPLSCRPPPPRSATRGLWWAAGPWQCVGQLDWSWLPMVSSLFNPRLSIRRSPAQTPSHRPPPPPPPTPPPPSRVESLISSILHTLRTYHASRHRFGGGQSRRRPLGSREIPSQPGARRRTCPSPAPAPLIPAPLSPAR